MDCNTPGFSCPSLSPGVCADSCPLSQWCHPTISFSVIPFSSCLQSFPASGSFPVSQFFASGDRSIEVSASASVLPMNVQDWFPLRLTGWISLQSKGLSKSLPQHHSPKASILRHSAFFMVQLSHPYTTTGKSIALGNGNPLQYSCLENSMAEEPATVYEVVKSRTPLSNWAHTHKWYHMVFVFLFLTLFTL